MPALRSRSTRSTGSRLWSDQSLSQIYGNKGHTGTALTSQKGQNLSFTNLRQAILDCSRRLIAFRKSSGEMVRNKTLLYPQAHGFQQGIGIGLLEIEKDCPLAGLMLNSFNPVIQFRHLFLIFNKIDIGRRYCRIRLKEWTGERNGRQPLAEWHQLPPA